jgi:5-methyltetrahydropteroyltriglutamate--homocysteine methyltransferase
VSRLNPPFRADHVGSLLRPLHLKDARARCQRGDITKEQLRGIEDEAIRDVVRKQEAIGLQSVTDGEFRRTFFHIDFLQRLQGVAVSGGIATKFRTRAGEIDFAPPRVTAAWRTAGGKASRTSGVTSASATGMRAATGTVTMRVDLVKHNN